jgi:hypothetical protein
MVTKSLLTQPIAAGWLLIFSFIIFLPAGLLYTGRAIWKWAIAQSHGYLIWERSLVMSAILVAAMGLVLLDKSLETAGDSVLPPLGMTLFLIATALVVAAETFSLSQQDWVNAPIVAFIVLAFIGQAVFGASILGTGLLPGWVGWATILWNLAWLIILPIASPKDMYYPVLHVVAPLVIGITLLIKA